MVMIRVFIALVLCGSFSGLLPQKKAVYVTASFLGSNRLYLENLTREDIRVFEGDQPREVQYFAGGEVPVAYGVLFDRELLPQPDEDPRIDELRISASTAARNVAYQLIDNCLGPQAGWTATYDDQGMNIALDFIQDASRIKDSIERMSGGRVTRESWLFGPLFNSVEKLGQRHEKRRILVVFLNTLDIKTSGKMKPLKNLLSASNVEVFFAGFAPRSTVARGLLPAQSEVALRELADVTAGAAYFTNMEGIEGLGRRMANQIRTFYTIGFESDSPGEQPARLKIECTRPGVKVKTHPVVPILQ